MRAIIETENLGKEYRIGAQQRPAYGTLREALTGAASSFVNLFRSKGGATESNGTHFWALQDVNIHVNQGEVLGIIGSNGAGKSTLLKILSRITEPTTGRAAVYGRVGSLLEVGTGFHPELSGRENIFLSGTILGMSRREIQRKFDEIVAFSENEKFLDTAVKHYSSGMYMRLAFSVAAHLEPEILLVDEVLAVGDIAFQRKCLDRMRKLRENGVTTLMVSHNMAVVQSACERAIFLNKGRIAAEGSPVEVIQQYREALRERAPDKPSQVMGEQQVHAGVLVTGFDLIGEDGVSRRTLSFGEAPRVRIELRATRSLHLPLIVLGIKRGDGLIITNFNNGWDGFKIDEIEGDCTLEGWLPPLRLMPYSYELYVLVFEGRTLDATGDLSQVKPLACVHVGDFSLKGPPLTEEDGVYQEPARRWILTQNGQRVEFSKIDGKSLERAFSIQPAETDPASCITNT